MAVLLLAGCGGGSGEHEHAGLTESAARAEAADAVIEFVQNPDSQIKGFQLGRVDLRVAKDSQGAEYWAVTAHDAHSAAAVCVRLSGGISGSTVVRACSSPGDIPATPTVPPASTGSSA